MVGWFGGGRLVALAAVLFANISLRRFARAVHFRPANLWLLLSNSLALKNYFPFGINVFLASMNLFHRAGIVAAKERTSQSSDSESLETKNNNAVTAPLNNQHTESNEEN